MMKTKVCLCAVLLAPSLPAALIDFNDMSVGTQIGSLNPYGDAAISTRYWATAGRTGPIIAESFTRGMIDDIGGSPSFAVESSRLVDPLRNDETEFWRNIQIGVTFGAPVSAFSVDLFTEVYSSRLIYSGINELGEAFTSSAFLPGSRGESTFNHFDIAAPLGAYITGFYFSQFENADSIRIAMDNLDYTTTTVAAPVPETLGLPTFAFTICVVLYLHRRMKAASQ
jgi:hypothetical protein